MDWGWIGGIGGSVLGLAGGVIGSCVALNKTRGPQERAFVARCVGYCWMGLASFVVLLVVLPHPYRWFVVIPYGIALTRSWASWNAQQARIRTDEASQRP